MNSIFRENQASYHTTPEPRSAKEDHHIACGISLSRRHKDAQKTSRLERQRPRWHQQFSAMTLPQLREAQCFKMRGQFVLSPDSKVSLMRLNTNKLCLPPLGGLTLEMKGNVACPPVPITKTEHLVPSFFEFLLFLNSFGDPDFNKRLPTHADQSGLPIQLLNHPLWKILIHVTSSTQGRLIEDIPMNGAISSPSSNRCSNSCAVIVDYFFIFSCPPYRYDSCSILAQCVVCIRGRCEFVGCCWE